MFATAWLFKKLALMRDNVCREISELGEGEGTASANVSQLLAWLVVLGKKFFKTTSNLLLD
jgi:hypothetical protein